MSGITGIIGARVSHPDAAAQVGTMVRRLRQHALEPVVEGTFRDEGLLVDVAWSRREHELGCIAWNERQDIGLIFCGEEFGLKNGTFSGNQSRPLIDSYEKFGPKFVSQLNGIFAGLLIDRRTKTVTLFNDRYGMGRVYYCADSTGFSFSTEAKSLLAIHPHLRQIDQRSLAEFYSVGCVLQNRSLFTGISLLPPGSWWTFHHDGTIKKSRYFDPAWWEQQEPLDAVEYTAQLTEVFSQLLPKYLRGAAPIGISLTGGLDSRMILAWAAAKPQTLPCYTFGGPYRDCADVRIARRLAKICAQPHSTLRIGPDFFEEFPRLAERTVEITDGTMDVSGAVELYINRLARQISPIRVTGNYGSEILRSHIAFRPARFDTSLFTPEFRLLLEEAAETYRCEAVGHRLSFIAFKQVPWHHYARYAAEKSVLTPRSPFLDNELVALAYRAPRALIGSAAPALQLISNGNASFDAVSTDRALRSRSIPGWTDVENRWQEFTAKAEYAYDYGMPPWLARADRVLKSIHLERLFLGRHKFYHFRVWYRDQLGPALRNGSFDFGRQPSCYVEGAARKLIHEHTAGKANHTLAIHKLLTVQLAERLFISSSCLT